MFFKRKLESPISDKNLIKKISWKLKANYFSVSEFQSLPKRKAWKVLGLILEIDKIQLSKPERKSIYELLLTIDTRTNSINSSRGVWAPLAKFLNWQRDVIAAPKKLSYSFKLFVSLITQYCYRTSTYELMRI